LSDSLSQSRFSHCLFNWWTIFIYKIYRLSKIWWLLWRIWLLPYRIIVL